MCLSKLAEAGASNQTLNLVASFLENRSMSFKLGDTKSTTRRTPGGAPQGTKSGNLLFTMSINDVETRTTRPTIPTDQTTTETTTQAERFIRQNYPSRPFDGDESFNQALIDTRGKRGTMRLDMTDDSTAEQQEWTQEMTASQRQDPARWRTEPPWVMKYVDDITTGCKSLILDGQAHISTRKEERHIHAQDLELFYDDIQRNSTKAGMKINSSKTQLLCLSQAINYNINSFIRVDGKKIEGGDCLKILGFRLGKRGDMTQQVKALKRGFAAGVWTLRHLKKMKIEPERLTAIYCCLLRAQLEYASVVYGTMLTDGQIRELERLQAIALKTIWGWDNSYEKCLEMSGLATLEDRRTTAIRDFAIKTSMNPRYGNWFPRNESGQHDLRRQETYKINFARHERLKRAPIYAMRRILNDLTTTDV